jgi:cobalt-zinc-cadmium efflux system outer membrane protein
MNARGRERRDCPGCEKELSMSKIRRGQAVAFAAPLLFAVLVCVAIPAAFAAENPPAAPATLTLAEAQRLAMQNNWDLLTAGGDVDAAKGVEETAHEFPNPTLNLTENLINVDRTSRTSMGNAYFDRSYDSIVGLNELFELGKRGHRQDSAAAGLQSARARFLDAKRQLTLNVANGYVAAVQAEENVRILKESAATLRKEAEIAAVRLKAGDISVTDKIQIEIAAERFDLDADSAEVAAVSARIALETLLGIKQPTGQWMAVENLDALAEVDAGEGREPTAPRPDLVAAQTAQRKAEADVRLQKAAAIPDLTLNAQYERQPPDQPNTVGFGLSLPVPFWNFNLGAVHTAAAASEQSRLAVEKTEAQIAADVLTARVTYRAAKLRWRAYRDSIRQRSAQVRQAVAYAYEKGNATLLDLLSAERNDNDVRLGAAQAAGDTAAAAAALKAAIGGQ